MLEEGSRCYTLENADQTEQFIGKLAIAGPDFFDSNYANRKAFIFATAKPNAVGVKLLQSYLRAERFSSESIIYERYRGVSGSSEVPPNVFQKMLVYWDSPIASGGHLKLYFQSNTPRSVMEFDSKMNAKNAAAGSRTQAISSKAGSSKKASPSSPTRPTRKIHTSFPTLSNLPARPPVKTKTTAIPFHKKPTSIPTARKPTQTRTAKNYPIATHPSKKPTPTRLSKKPTSHDKLTGQEKGKKDK